jgi:hypothetical protein
MNIKRLDHEISSPLTRNGEKRVHPGDRDFQKILEGITEARTMNPAGSSEVTPTAPFSIPLLEFFSEPTTGASSRADSVKTTESVLDLLEDYQKAIGDPRVTLKEMGGLIQSLAQKTNELNEWSQKLSAEDPLQKIMSEVGSISAVELEKFHQGRYV